MEKFYFLGDSITAGQLINPHETWVNMFSTQIVKNNANRLVQQIATNGDTTDQAISKLEYQVAQHAPENVFIQFGLNDANRWQSQNCANRVPLDKFQKNLRQIIQVLRTAKVKDIYLFTSHRILKNHSCKNCPTLDDDIRSYNLAIRRIAEVEISCFLIDFEKESSEWPDSFLLADGIHLSKLGHRLYAEKLLEIFI